MLCSVLVSVLSFSSAAAPDALPERALAILEKAETLELLSLDPVASEKEKPQGGGHFGWKVLGRTALKGEAREAAVGAVKAGVAGGKDGARCFWPRHALHAAHEGKTVDLVICFECSWVHVFYDGKKENPTVLTTDGSPQAALDKMLREAKVPLPPAPAPKAGGE